MSLIPYVFKSVLCESTKLMDMQQKIMSLEKSFCSFCFVLLFLFLINSYTSMYVASFLKLFHWKQLPGKLPLKTLSVTKTVELCVLKPKQWAESR